MVLLRGIRRIYDIAEGEWILRSDLEIDCPELVAKFDHIDSLPPNSRVSQIKTKAVAPTPMRINPRRAVRAQPTSTGDGVDVTL